MKFKTLILFAILALSLPIAAQEFSDYRRHGNCMTGTISDPMSDASGAFVFCGSEPTVFVIAQEAVHLGMYLGIQSTITKMVADGYPLEELRQFPDSEVKLRIDKGKILTASGRFFKDGFLYIEDNALAEEIMRQISNGQKLHFSIDDTPTETIQLGGAQDAVGDMRERLKSE